MRCRLLGYSSGARLSKPCDREFSSVLTFLGGDRAGVTANSIDVSRSL
ncbi:hypothetical protein QT970_19175 [Microcoleus sp. herbarium8]